jgi:hypothetical protein
MEQRVTTEFPEWVPPQERYKNGPIHQPEHRKPKYYLSFFNGPEADEWHDEVYLINSTDKSLSQVTTASGGFSGLHTLESFDVHYKQVEPDHAIKIEEYHRMFDSDFIKQITVYVEEANGVEKGYSVILGKTETARCIVLEWNTREYGKGVSKR